MQIFKEDFQRVAKNVTDSRVCLNEALINGVNATIDVLKPFNGPGSVLITR